MEEIDINQLMRPKKVCVCKQVSKEEIIACIQKGATSFEDISNRTLAGTNCGTCRKEVETILETELKKLGRAL